jgi:hypothetical protein
MAEGKVAGEGKELRVCLWVVARETEFDTAKAREDPFAFEFGTAAGFACV